MTGRGGFRPKNSRLKGNKELTRDAILGPASLERAGYAVGANTSDQVADGVQGVLEAPSFLVRGRVGAHRLHLPEPAVAAARQTALSVSPFPCCLGFGAWYLAFGVGWKRGGVMVVGGTLR